MDPITTTTPIGWCVLGAIALIALIYLAVKCIDHYSQIKLTNVDFDSHPNPSLPPPHGLGRLSESPLPNKS